MLTVEEILDMQRSRKAKPTEDDLRKLPYKKAFIYGRVSDPRQVRDSKESIREVAKLVALAKSDGYETSLDPEEVEKWVLSIEPGDTVGKVLEDGSVILDVQDLGVSASGLSDEKREGLAHQRKRIENGDVGAVYVTEGVSRLSRDQDSILPFQLLKLFKQQECRLRTPDGIWNPAIERDWEELKDEFEHARHEHKIRRARLHRRKAQKAARGEFVGEPVPPGFILPIVGQKPSGQYQFGKYEPYPPHAEVDTRILTELVAQGGSVMRTIRARGGLMFPLFPEEFAYMERLSALRLCQKTPFGYRITPELIRGLARNIKLIGVWQWGDAESIPNNHEPAVEQDLWLAAYEASLQPGKPKGRAVYHEPLEYAGILWCFNHSDPDPVSNCPSEGSYRCQRDYFRGRGDICLDIAHHLIDTPLTTEVLRQLDFAVYADEVLTKLETEAAEDKIEEAERNHRIAELERRLENLAGYLGCGNEEREEAYWQQHSKTKADLDELRAKPLPKRKVATADIQQVREFLSGLQSNWASYSPTLRNRLLKLLLERVELRHDRQRIEARILWKAGLQQTVTIYRPIARGSRDKRWTDEEDSLLRMLWPSSPKHVVKATMTNRSWKSICCHATHLELKRERGRPESSPKRRWKPDEEAEVKIMYEAGVPMDEIVAKFGRQCTAILNKAAKQGWRRAPSARWHKSEATWHADDLKVLQSEPSRHWLLPLTHHDLSGLALHRQSPALPPPV